MTRLIKAPNYQTIHFQIIITVSAIVLLSMTFSSSYEDSKATLFLECRKIQQIFSNPISIQSLDFFVHC